MSKKRKLHVNTASKSLLTLFDDAASAHLNSQPETLNDHLNRYFASLQRSPGASTPMQKSKDRIGHLVVGVRCFVNFVIGGLVARHLKRWVLPRLDEVLFEEWQESMTDLESRQRKSKAVPHGFDEGAFKYTPAAASGTGQRIILNKKEIHHFDSYDKTPQQLLSSSPGSEPSAARMHASPALHSEGANPTGGPVHKRPTARKSLKLGRTAKRQTALIQSVQSDAKSPAAWNDIKKPAIGHSSPKSDGSPASVGHKTADDRATGESMRFISNPALIESTALGTSSPKTRARLSGQSTSANRLFETSRKGDVGKSTSNSSARDDEKDQTLSEQKHPDEPEKKRPPKRRYGKTRVARKRAKALSLQTKRSVKNKQAESDVNLKSQPSISSSESELSSEAPGKFSELHSPAVMIDTETHCKNITFVRNQLSMLREPLFFAGSLQRLYNSCLNGDSNDEEKLPITVIERVVRLYNNRLLRYNHQHQDEFDKAVSFAAAALDHCSEPRENEKSFWRHASSDNNFVPPELPIKVNLTRDQCMKYQALVESIRANREARNKKRDLLQNTAILSRTVRDLAKRCRQAEATSSRSVAEKKIFLGKIRRGMTDAEEILQELLRSSPEEVEAQIVDCI